MVKIRTELQDALNTALNGLILLQNEKDLKDFYIEELKMFNLVNSFTPMQLT